MYPVIPFPFAVEKQLRQTRPQDPIVLVLSPPRRTVLVIVIESRQQRQTPFSTTNDSTFIEIKSQLVRIVAMLSTI